MFVIKWSGVPVKVWRNDISEIEDSALDQIYNLSLLPFAHHHVAIMPDVHSGYGMPIGGVLATYRVIIPNAVGVDIGCGMCAVKTDIKVEDLPTETLKKIMGIIRNTVPVGFNRHKEEQEVDLIFDGFICKREFSNARKSLGTLGGGNHFIEIQKDADNYVWIMIHSGSRNLGKQVADHYNKLAVGLNDKWHSSVPKKHQLAFLPTDSEEGINYIDEMQACVHFAFLNRKTMMARVMEAFGECGYNLGDPEVINIAHNYAKLENHFNKNVWVHRKGATSAKEGEVGIIPGSQGTRSYIVKGLGNKESFCSCSHGAGRIMSRTRARNELDLQEQKKLLDDKNVVHSVRHEKDLDEAPGAYKDIDEVIALQQDLVEVVEVLTPIGVIKG